MYSYFNNNGFAPQYPNYLQQQQQGGIIYVNGIEGAKAHFVAPGNSSLLMDSDSSRFFIKTANAQGQMFIRTFEFQEVNNDKKASVDYATKDDLKTTEDKLITKLEELLTKLGGNQ